MIEHLSRELMSVESDDTARSAHPPTFSVLIPAYNAAPFLARSIGTALTQTYPPHEVIVCNDGSTDETPQIAADFGVTVVNQENRGLAAARNAAARYATGDYLVLLDADDWWAPDRLEAISRAISENPRVEIFTTDAVIIGDGDPRRWYERNTFPSDTSQRTAILAANFVFVSAAISRRLWQKLGGMDERLPRAEDYDFFLRAVLSGARVHLVPYPLAYYYRHGANMSANRVAQLATVRTILQKAACEFHLHGDERKIVAKRLEDIDRKIATLMAIALGKPTAMFAAALKAPNFRAATRLRISASVFAHIARRWKSARVSSPTGS